ncbi:Uncharacterised protein [Mycobacteroides abscessus subsp. abscessus]|nr:Uncharacterised protein [Mycobacteroides abscessus subsp. abscessus]
MHVTVDAAGGHDPVVTGDDLGGRSHDQGGVHPVHDVRVSRLADSDDAAVADTDVGLDDSPVVDDDRAGDDRIGSAAGTGEAALPHRLP